MSASAKKVSRANQGRPPVTDHDEIERVAFNLFADKGFDATTIDDIATAVGIGRRTLFRYFPSKNDIPWGQFDASLAGLRDRLESSSADLPVFQAVHLAVLAFNHVDPAALPQHRQRMRLLLRTPALQAHSVLRYAEWRDIITTYVARRLGLPETDLLPRTIGQVTLAISLSAYEQWLEDETLSLEEQLEDALSGIVGYFGGASTN